MNFSVITSLFKSKNTTVGFLDSKILKNIQNISKQNNFLLYKNKTIYHHATKITIPLLMLEPSRGIYIFEYKTWSFETLKNATIQNSKEEEEGQNTLAFDKTHKIIRQKFNELTHKDGVDIFNFAIMENLSTLEYENLDDSLKKHLPKNRIIFNDSSDEEILKKIQSTKEKDNSMPEAQHITGNLFIQYLILDKDIPAHMATQKQMEFIDADIHGHVTLFGEKGSGKTNAILLKTILYKLENPQKKVLILSATVLSCDMFKQKLLNIVEHAIIELDITSIEVITPAELIERHLGKKQNGFLQNDTIHIDSKLMKKKFHIADLLICDDCDLLPDDFILYLKHIQKKSNLIISTNTHTPESTFVFEEKFNNKNTKTLFIKTNPHAKTMQLISKLLKDNKPEDIMVVCGELSKKQLLEDLKSYINEEIVLLDTSKNLIDQKLSGLLLATSTQINPLSAKFVIIFDIESICDSYLSYVIKTATQTAYVLFEEENEKIAQIKQRYKKS